MSGRVAAVARVLVRAYGRDFDTDEIAARALKAADRAAAKEAAATPVTPGLTAHQEGTQ